MPPPPLLRPSDSILQILDPIPNEIQNQTCDVWLMIGHQPKTIKQALHSFFIYIFISGNQWSSSSWRSSKPSSSIQKQDYFKTFNLLDWKKFLEKPKKLTSSISDGQSTKPLPDLSTFYSSLGFGNPGGVSLSHHHPTISVLINVSWWPIDQKKKKNHTYWCQEWWLVLVTLFHPYKAQVHTFQIQKKFKSLGFFFFFFCEISFLPTNLELLFFSLVFHFPFSPSLLKTWDTWLGDHFLLTTLCRTQDFLFNPSSKKNSRHRLSISMWNQVNGLVYILSGSKKKETDWACSIDLSTDECPWRPFWVQKKKGIEL